MTKETKHSGSFVASDENGDEHTVNIFTDFHVTRDRGGTHRSEGMKSLQLQDGTPVNRIDQGHYETVALQKNKLTSTDPAAP